MTLENNWGAVICHVATGIILGLVIHLERVVVVLKTLLRERDVKENV